MNDRSVRTLTHLEASASTARVLNLLRVRRWSQADPSYALRPFFKNPVLNKSLILKHRLRRNEAGLFFDDRRTATKIIIPIDGEELKLGGRYVFVNQINYHRMLDDFLGPRWAADPADRELLGHIDRLPSLDPFLLREHLNRHGYNPARCYFDVSDADLKRMLNFVEREIQRLIDLCYVGRADSADEERRGSRLARKILSSAVDAETEPLRQTLRLEKPDYQEGVFCWKGFLYYKWTLREALPDVTKVADTIRTVRPRGPMDHETQVHLDKARTDLHASILAALEQANKSLRNYDNAFSSLIDGKPMAFRDFLLDAPSMFCELGERLGAVTHIVSFWNFRFPTGQRPVVTGAELVDIIADFEESLAFCKREASPFLLAC
jgi:hypothetical protein